jgi:hypothetical protein
MGDLEEFYYDNNKDFYWYDTRDSTATPTLMGADGAQVTDIQQGGLGNCYFQAAVAAVAEDQDRFMDMWVTQEFNDEGVVGMYMYIRGLKVPVTTDDNLPFTDYGWTFYLPYGQMNSDGSMWGAFAEKFWSKVNCNYEYTSGGYIGEAMRVLAGAPCTYNSLAYMTADTVWTDLSAHDGSNYIMGAGTAGSGNDQEQNDLGLAMSHAFTVLGVNTITDSATGEEVRLVRIRNPWGSEQYSGPWSDGDDSWTAENKAQIEDWDSAVADGIFFIDIDSFVLGYSDYSVCMVRDDYQISWYDNCADDGSSKTYYFTAPEDLGEGTTAYVGMDFYDPRMIPADCWTSGWYNMGSLTLSKVSGGGSLANLYFAGYMGFDNAEFELEAGVEYKITSTATWYQTDDKDFTVRIYSPYAMDITDESGDVAVTKLCTDVAAFYENNEEDNTADDTTDDTTEDDTADDTTEDDTADDTTEDDTAEDDTTDDTTEDDTTEDDTTDDTTEDDTADDDTADDDTADDDAEDESLSQLQIDLQECIANYDSFGSYGCYYTVSAGWYGNSYYYAFTETYDYYWLYTYHIFGSRDSLIEAEGTDGDCVTTFAES